MENIYIYILYIYSEVTLESNLDWMKNNQPNRLGTD